MKLFSVILLIVSSLFGSIAYATTPAYPTFYTAAGIFQYQITTKPIVPMAFNIGNFTTLGLCNAAISDFNNLLIPGSNTPNPNNALNTRSVLDALCFAVLPPQIPGWHVLGFAQVQQHGQLAVPISFDIGSFQDEITCGKALAKMQALHLSNTPGNATNVFYSFTGGCYKLTD